MTDLTQFTETECGRQRVPDEKQLGYLATDAEVQTVRDEHGDKVFVQETDNAEAWIQTDRLWRVEQ